MISSESFTMMMATTTTIMQMMTVTLLMDSVTFYSSRSNGGTFGNGADNMVLGWGSSPREHKEDTGKVLHSLTCCSQVSISYDFMTKNFVFPIIFIIVIIMFCRLHVRLYRSQLAEPFAIKFGLLDQAWIQSLLQTIFTAMSITSRAILRLQPQNTSPSWDPWGAGSPRASGTCSWSSERCSKGMTVTPFLSWKFSPKKSSSATWWVATRFYSSFFSASRFFCCHCFGV